MWQFKIYGWIKFYTEKLELEENCVLSVIYPTKKDKDAYTLEERELLDVLQEVK